MISKYSGRSFVFDVETNGLLPEVSIIHCAVAIDIDTEEVLDFGPTQIREFLQLYQHAKLLIGHNIIGYDCPVIEKLYGIPIPPAERLIDTLQLARLVFPDIKTSDFKRAKAWNSYTSKCRLWLSEQLKRYERLNGEPAPDDHDFGEPPITKPKVFFGWMAGFHTLESWGYRMGGELKGDYAKECKEQGIDPWAAWNPEMHAYMIQDGKVNLQLYRYLMQYNPTPLSVLIEMRTQLLCTQMERNGWPFDQKAAEELYMDLAAQREALHQQLISLFPPWSERLPDFIPKRNNKTKGYIAGVPVERWDHIEFNPKSRDHIADRLQNKYGWEPLEFTDGGKPKIDDDVLQDLPYPEAKPLARYFMLTKRIAQIAEGKQAWLKMLNSNGRIHGRYNTNGAVSGRATHSSPNVSQVPASKSEYGKECRALFKVPKGWKQVGADQAGLELRCLASYMSVFDGGAYIQVVLFGDVHWENAKVLVGLPPDTERYAGVDEDGHAIENPLHEAARNLAKTFIYAFLYGSGDENLGSLIGVTDEDLAEWRGCPQHREAYRKMRDELYRRANRYGDDPPTQKRIRFAYKGHILRQRFLKGLPALEQLIKRVKGNKETKARKDKRGNWQPAKAASGAGRGWLKGLDGRIIPVRAEHAALNTLLQSAGAIICKQWIVEAEADLLEAGLKHGWDGDFVFLGWIHDEIQIAVREGLEAQVSEIVVAAARRAGEPFSSWNCPTDGDSKIGLNWAECH